MCTVCQKIYGRYNSVSYHVTIYHRNPPIRCDEEGCKFSTREARYIHFHKFYRHRVPLPENIDLGKLLMTQFSFSLQISSAFVFWHEISKSLLDLGSRKCVLCRHISKSPAMLEKHISRHLQYCTKTGQDYQCPQCEKQASSQQEMLDHMVIHVVQEEPSFPCEHCKYRYVLLSVIERSIAIILSIASFQIMGRWKYISEDKQKGHFDNTYSSNILPICSPENLHAATVSTLLRIRLISPHTTKRCTRSCSIN